MATYTVSKTNTTFIVRYRFVGTGPYTENRRRGFTSFDLTGLGLSLGSIISVELILNCTARLNDPDIALYSGSAGDNWGTTLDASAADFNSTAVNLEDVVSITSTGTKTFSVDKNHLDLNGVNWFSFRVNNAEVGQKDATFNSVNAGTVANRPILRITLSSGRMLSIMGVGS